MAAVIGKTEAFFVRCYEDLKSQKNDLTDTEYTWAKTTIRAIEMLFKQKDFFSSITDESARNQKITDLTKLVAEKCLISGGTEAEIEYSITQRVEELKKAYFFDAERGETFLFFRKAFLGPPCFNGRVNTLQDYIIKRQGVKPKQFYERKCEYDNLAVVFEEFMYRYDQQYGRPGDVPPELADLLSFVKADPDLAVKYPAHLSFTMIEMIYKRACQFYLEFS